MLCAYILELPVYYLYNIYIWQVSFSVLHFIRGHYVRFKYDDFIVWPKICFLQIRVALIWACLHVPHSEPQAICYIAGSSISFGRIARINAIAEATR